MTRVVFLPEHGCSGGVTLSKIGASLGAIRCYVYKMCKLCNRTKHHVFNDSDCYNEEICNIT